MARLRAAAVAPDDRTVTLLGVVLRLAWPAVLSSLVQTLVFLADRVMLGRYDQNALGSMQVQGPVLWSVFSVFFAGLVGTVALVSQNVGRGDLRAARATARIALAAGAALGLLVGGGVGLLAEPIAVFFGPDDATVVGYATGYLRVASAGTAGLFVASTAAMVLQGYGDTRTPLVVGVFTNGLNILLDALLIFGADTPLGRIPELGVTGAAIGTSTAFVAEAVLLAGVLARRDHPIGLRRPALLPAGEHARLARKMLRLAGPAVLDRLAIHVGFLAFVRVISSLGPRAMAANQALITLESICFLTADGFAVAAAAVMGQHLGAARTAGARRGTLLAVAMAVTVLSILGVSLWAAGPRLLAVFVPEGVPPEPLVETAAPCLVLLALAQPVMAIAVVVAQALRAAGDTRTPFVAALLGSLVVRVGAAHALAVGAGLGLVGIWWASTLDWSVRTVLLLGAFARGRWTRGALDP